MRIDYSLLMEPYRHLRLEREFSYWMVVGADGDTVYYRTEDVLGAVRFMRAFSLKHTATIDEDSVAAALEDAEAFAWARAQRSGEDPVGVEPDGGSVSQAVRGELASSPGTAQQAYEDATRGRDLTPGQAHTLALNRLIDLLRDPHSRRVDALAPVIPIRKDTA